MTTQTYPTFSQQELVRAFAEEYPELKLRDDDFNNPQVVLQLLTVVSHVFVGGGLKIMIVVLICRSWC